MCVCVHMNVCVYACVCVCVIECVYACVCVCACVSTTVLASVCVSAHTCKSVWWIFSAKILCITGTKPTSKKSDVYIVLEIPDK